MLNKAFIQDSFGLNKGRKGLPIGTVRNGRKKVAEGKWVPVKKDNKNKQSLDDKLKILNKRGFNFSKNNTVSLKDDVNLISYLSIKNKELKIKDVTSTGLISEPLFLKVTDENGKDHEINPTYLKNNKDSYNKSDNDKKFKEIESKIKDLDNKILETDKKRQSLYQYSWDSDSEKIAKVEEKRTKALKERNEVEYNKLNEQFNKLHKLRVHTVNLINEEYTKKANKLYEEKNKLTKEAFKLM